MSALNYTKRIFAVLCILMLGLGSIGCSYDKYDPAVYPLQFEEVKTFPKTVGSVRSILIDSTATEQLLVDYFTPPDRTTERYFQIESPLGAPVLERYELQEPLEVYRPIAEYNFLDLWQCGQDSNYVMYRTSTDSTMNIFLLNLTTKEEISLFNIFEPTDSEGIKQNFYASSFFIPSMYKDEIYIGIIYWINEHKWYLRVSHMIDNNIVIDFDISIGTSISHIMVINIDDDGTNEFLCQTTAPYSGFKNDIFSDDHVYSILLSDNGELRWYTDHGKGGGSNNHFYKDNTLYCIRYYSAFTASNTTLISRINHEDGNIIWNKEYNDKCTLVEGCLNELKLLTNGTSVVNQLELRPDGIIETPLPGMLPISNAVCSVVDISQSDLPWDELYCIEDNGNTMFLNEDFENVGFLRDARFVFAVSQLVQGKYVLGKNLDKQYLILKPRAASWTSWWIRRYRYHIVFAIVVPLVIALVFVGLRAAIIHRQAERAKQEARDKLNSMMTGYVRKIKGILNANSDERHGLKNDIQRILDHLQELLKNGSVKLSESEREDLVTMFNGVIRRLEKGHSGHEIYDSNLTFEELAQSEVNACMKRTDLKGQLVSEIEKDPPDDIRELFFDITVETLRNIEKHATASEFMVKYNYNQDLYSLEVSDDGQGFELEDFVKAGIHGLSIIRSRVNLQDGEFQIRNIAEGGTRITVAIPDPFKPCKQRKRG